MLLIVAAPTVLTHILCLPHPAQAETALGGPLCARLHLPTQADPPALAASATGGLLTLLGLPPDSRVFPLL